MQICRLFFYSILKLLELSHDFLPLTIAELSMLKQVRFLAHPVYTNAGGLL